MNNNKKNQLENLFIMSTIGFIVGSGVSIIGSVPFVLSALTFTTVCGTISAAKTGLIGDAIIKFKKSDNQVSNLHPVAKEHVEEKAKTFELSQEKIDEIHAKGKMTPAEKVAEWESLGLCAPGDEIGSASDRCRKFEDCHKCLVDYASDREEYEPMENEIKICNSFIDDFKEELNNVESCPQVGSDFTGTEEETSKELDSGIIKETTKEEQGPVKELIKNKK